MAWGAPRGVDDLIAKLKDNTTASTMCILSTRRFGQSEAVAFSGALSGNTSLKELLASGHRLDAAGATAFGEALATNTTLRSLCVGDNEFGDEGVLALVAGLQRNRGLLVLDLEYKSIASGEGLEALLKEHPTLADLRLGRNQLGEAGIHSLAAGLSLSSTLLRLDLSGNLLNPAAAKALGNALRRRSDNAPGTTGPPPLEFLDVSRNPLGDEGGAALFRALATSPTLTALVVAEAGLGVGAAAALAEALAPYAAIAAAAAAAAAAGEGGLQTGSSDESAAMPPHPPSTSSPPLSPPVPPPTTALEKQCGGFSKLKTIDVSKNEFGAEGTAELAGALSRGGGASLESLSIGYNGVGDDGAAALGRAAGPRLAVLDLSGNALSGAGLGAIVSTPGLREAKLFHNACGDEGVPLLLEALLAHGALETLDLGANGLTGAGFEALLPGLAACSSLQTLEVGANSNDDRAEEAVRQSQRNNPSLDIAFRRGGEAMEGSGGPPGVGVGGGVGAAGAPSAQ